GQGSQHAGMGRGLYEHEPAFRSWADRCCDLLVPRLGVDLRERLYAPDAPPPDQTWLAQPALFVTAYALARTLMEWGVRPDAVIGHSLGEYVAACVAGMFSLEDALDLVALRGRLMEEQPAGAMAAVGLDGAGLLGPPAAGAGALRRRPAPARRRARGGAGGGRPGHRPERPGAAAGGGRRAGGAHHAPPGGDPCRPGGPPGRPGPALAGRRGRG